MDIERSKECKSRIFRTFVKDHRLSLGYHFLYSTVVVYFRMSPDRRGWPVVTSPAVLFLTLTLTLKTLDLCGWNKNHTFHSMKLHVLPHPINLNLGYVQIRILWTDCNDLTIHSRQETS